MRKGSGGRKLVVRHQHRGDSGDIGVRAGGGCGHEFDELLRHILRYMGPRGWLTVSGLAWTPQRARLSATWWYRQGRVKVS
jgi:hypothetical protein